MKLLTYNSRSALESVASPRIPLHAVQLRPPILQPPTIRDRNPLRIFGTDSLGPWVVTRDEMARERTAPRRLVQA